MEISESFKSKNYFHEYKCKCGKVFLLSQKQQLKEHITSRPIFKEGYKDLIDNMQTLFSKVDSDLLLPCEMIFEIYLESALKAQNPFKMQNLTEMIIENKEIEVRVMNIGNNRIHTFKIDPTITIGQFCEIVAKELVSTLDDMRLVYKNKGWCTPGNADWELPFSAMEYDPIDKVNFIRRLRGD